VPEDRYKLQQEATGRAIADLQHAIPQDAGLRAQTWGDKLKYAKDQIGKIVAPFVGLDWQEMADDESRGILRQMLVFGPRGSKIPDMTDAYHGTTFHNLPDLLEWVRNPEARPVDSLSARGSLDVTDTFERAARYANAQVTRNPSLAYAELQPGAAVVKIKVPRPIEWINRGTNYRGSLDEVEHRLLSNEKGLSLEGVHAVVSPYGLDHSGILPDQLQILKPNPALIDRMYGGYNVRTLLESMGLGDLLKITH
jgi:hypothetical protein